MSPGQPRQVSIDTSDEDLETPGLGDIVAIVQPSSTPIQPVVELGKVLRISTDWSQLRYIPLESVGGSNYSCTAGRLGRAAVDNIVFPIGTDYDEGTRTYTLLCDPYDIHMAQK